MNKTVLITGATSGFGLATARVFAQHQYRLIITGRRSDRLESIKNELIKEFSAQVLTLCFDIRSLQQTRVALNQIPADFKPVDILINNAGLALNLASIDEGDFEDWDTMIDTNVKGILYITRLLLPEMKKRKQGHIVNISSTAGKETYRYGNVYCATKHAVDSLTKAMRIDLLPYGIKVSSISPGAAETEFSLVRFKGDTERAKHVYRGYQPLHAEDIANTIWYVVNQPEHVCINDVVITAKAQANSFYIEREGE
jgi:NADP-dependent 3-hydroxy acid dehydrogenase YdfG